MELFVFFLQLLFFRGRNNKSNHKSRRKMLAKSAKQPKEQEVEVVGLLTETSFHVAAGVAEALKRNFPTMIAEPKITPLLEFAWDEFLQEKKKELRGETWAYPSKVMCFVDGQLIGDEKMILHWAYDVWQYKEVKTDGLYQAILEDFVTKYMRNKKHVFVFLDITIGEKPIGQLLFELFNDICPKTCKNFWCLCTGEKGTNEKGVNLTYKDSIFHRLVKNGWIQGGDIVQGKGDGGTSIYGPVFADESFAVRHDKRGVLGMVNKGRHTNGSQFYITLQATPYLNDSYVAFGQVIKGSSVLRQLEEVETFNERPLDDCRIVDCGIYRP